MSLVQSAATSINDFPNEILSHILSFLPIKDAFRTSFLLKRWLPLYHSLPDLHFDDDGVNNAEDWIHFRQMLDAIMLSPRSQDLTLKSFHLKCRRSNFWETEADCFHKWVEAAKRRCIKDLRMTSILLNIPLASTIFCCETLVVLNLIDLRVATMFHCYVHLPSLKILNLCLIHIQFEDMEDLMKLLSGCPMLEDLNIGHVEATTGVTPGGYFKPLPNLIKANIRQFEVPFRVVYNVHFLCVFGVCYFYHQYYMSLILIH